MKINFNSLFDTIESRYAKLRRTAHNFTICQFGELHVFNIYY